MSKPTQTTTQQQTGRTIETIRRASAMRATC